MRFKNHEGIACGIHTQNPDLRDWNTALVESYLTQSPSILIHWAKRDRGLVTRERSDISHIEDVIGKRLVARQSGSGAQELLEKQLDVAGIAIDSVNYVKDSPNRDRGRVIGIGRGGGRVVLAYVVSPTDIT